MRRTDNARILDIAEHPLLKSALQDGPTVLIKRKRDDATEPCIETQHRKVLGKLPIAYTCALGSCLTLLQPQAAWTESIPETITAIVTS